MTLRIAILGHVTAAPTALPVPTNERKAKLLVETYNFTRVHTADNELVDHLAYLKAQRGLPKEESFSVWDMDLCAVLVLESLLCKLGHEVRSINYLDSDNADRELDGLAQFDPHIVIVSTTFVLTRNHLATIGKMVRPKLPKAFILAGGHHVFTALMKMTDQEKADYLESVQMDGFIEDSQGEHALTELCRHFPDNLAVVPNLVWRQKEGGAKVNPRVPEENDIHATALDLSLLRERRSAIHIRTARSCAFRCAFCSYPTIAGPLSLMDLDVVINTLRQAQDWGIPALFFVDDTFNVPKDRFTELMDRMIAEKIHLPWYSFLRCQYIDEPLVAKMKQTGCAGVFLGAESGSDKVLKSMKKGAISRFYWDGIRWLKENGIVTVGSFLVGFPGETDQTVAETTKFINESGLDFYFIQPFYYLHHTPVHKNAAQHGLTGEGLYWSHKTMDWKQAIQHINRMFLEIDQSIFVNPDYTLWEIAYLRTKGLSLDEIKAYRREVNQMTVTQMERFGIAAGNSTSRFIEQVAV